MARITLLVLVLVVVGAAALIGAILWLRARRRVARLESENARLREDLERARSGRETFFDLVTHELRSPLSAILGYQELLEDSAYGVLPDHAAEPMVRIGRSARHLLHLIDGVVELSRIRSGTVRLDLDDVNLGVLFAAVVEAFRVTARERRIEARVHVDPALPTIRSDQERLLRALDLLTTSALKHPDGDVMDLHITADPTGATVRIRGTELEFPDNVDDLVLRVGIRLAVVDGIARSLGGGLEFQADDDGIVRALSFHIRDLATGPDPTL